VTRCAGHCCRVFSLPYGPEEMKTRAPGFVDGEQIAAMVKHLGHGLAASFPGAPPHTVPAHYYTCTNHDPETGDCRAYETRPGMCSDFPYGKPCPYPDCAVPRYTVHVPLDALTRRAKKYLVVESDEAKEAACASKT
jgi:Fe-S-cluster containining protein